MDNINIDDTTIEVLSEDYSNYDLSFKIIVIGDSGVGKSCLTMRATKNLFDTNYNATVGFEFFTFNVKINNQVIKLQVWDTCGQEIYRSLITNFYRNSSLAIMVYSIDNKESFDNIDIWLKELKTHANPDAKVFLIGNKQDLESGRQITKELASKYKNDYGLDLHMECSALSGFNARDVFIEATKMLYKDYLNYKPSQNPSFISNNSDNAKSNRKINNSKVIIPDDNKKEKPKKSGCC